jgi:hypothetical protein
MHVDRRAVERICPFPAAALPTRVKMIKFGDNRKSKVSGSKVWFFPCFYINIHNYSRKTAILVFVERRVPTTAIHWSSIDPGIFILLTFCCVTPDHLC